MNKRSGKTGGVSRRLIALLLCCVCLFGAVSGSAIALKAYAATEETAAATEPAAQPPVEETKAPVEETKAPTEETKASTEETTKPTDETTKPTDETTKPTEETTEPTQETTEPTEETTEPTQENAEPTDVVSLFDRLMACTSYKEFLEIIKSLTEETRQLLEQFTQEQKDALAAKTVAFADVLEDRAAAETRTQTLTIEQGSFKEVKVEQPYTLVTGKIKGAPSVTGNTGGIQVEGNDSYYLVKVPASVGAGTYTFTVSYDVLYKFVFSEYTDTVTVTVTKPAQKAAQVYYLTTPNASPDGNATEIWGGPLAGGATVRIPADANWQDQSKNLYNPENYVEQLGTLQKASEGWELKRTDDSTAYNAIFEAWKGKVTEQLQKDYPGITINIDISNVRTIYLIPHKISRNNGTNPDLHVDCRVKIETTGVAYYAEFQVQEPGVDSFSKFGDGKYYPWNEPVKGPTEEVKTTKTVDGVTYKFDGWYTDKEFTKKADMPYSPTKEQKESTGVIFYGRYVRASYDLTIQKTLSGNMYDEKAKFSFTVNYPSLEQPITLELGKDQEYKVQNIPNGVMVTITEVDSKGYVASFTATSPKTLKLDGTGETRTFTITS